VEPLARNVPGGLGGLGGVRRTALPSDHGAIFQSAN